MEDRRPDENTIVQRYFQNHVEPVMTQLFALGGDVGLIEGPAAVKLRDALNDAAIILEIYQTDRKREKEIENARIDSISHKNT
jgi:hypothetical protein